jgi:hypothetical protein
MGTPRLVALLLVTLVLPNSSKHEWHTQGFERQAMCTVVAILRHPDNHNTKNCWIAILAIGRYYVVHSQQSSANNVKT